MLLLRDKSKIHFTRTNKELKFCFTMSEFISSKPGILPPFKEKNAVFISPSEKDDSWKELLDLKCFISKDLCEWSIADASFSPTLRKYSSKLLVMVFRSKIFLLVRMRCFSSELFTNLPFTNQFLHHLPSFLYVIFATNCNLWVILRLCPLFNWFKKYTVVLWLISCS